MSAGALYKTKLLTNNRPKLRSAIGPKINEYDTADRKKQE